MAIELNEKPKKGINWKIIIIVAVILGVVLLAAYFLFFAPTPRFDVSTPPSLKTARDISTSSVDPENVVNSQAFKSLRNYAPLPSVGLIGRDNPFLVP